MSRRTVDQTAAWLQSQGVKAVPYHAGLSDELRERHQNQFARDEADVVVATVAFGMGIDKSNVRLVVHRDMPKSVEAWYQEIGRAGRDGLVSDCVVFYSYADVIGYDSFLEGIEDEAQRDETRRKTLDLFRMFDRGGCRHQAACASFDETIEPCGASCDTCMKIGVGDLVVASRVTARAVVRGGRGGAVAELDDGAAERFERLRAVRRRLADAESVPAYIVFSDAVLREMAVRRPSSEAELLDVPGIGPAKMQRYGAEFLAELTRG
jgi:ATP-dependent DNA helicase RecQ